MPAEEEEREGGAGIDCMTGLGESRVEVGRENAEGDDGAMGDGSAARAARGVFIGVEGRGTPSVMSTPSATFASSCSSVMSNTVTPCVPSLFVGSEGPPSPSEAENTGEGTSVPKRDSSVHEEDK